AVDDALDPAHADPARRDRRRAERTRLAGGVGVARSLLPVDRTPEEAKPGVCRQRHGPILHPIQLQFAGIPVENRGELHSAYWTRSVSRRALVLALESDQFIGQHLW